MEGLRKGTGRQEEGGEGGVGIRLKKVSRRAGGGLGEGFRRGEGGMEKRREGVEVMWRKSGRGWGVGGTRKGRGGVD